MRKPPADFDATLRSFDSRLRLAWHPHRNEWAVEIVLQSTVAAKMEALKKINYRIANRPVLSHLPDEKKAKALELRTRARSMVDALNRGQYPILYAPELESEQMREAILETLFDLDDWRKADHLSIDPQSHEAGHKVDDRQNYEDDFADQQAKLRLRRIIRDATRDAFINFAVYNGAASVRRRARG